MFDELDGHEICHELTPQSRERTAQKIATIAQSITFIDGLLNKYNIDFSADQSAYLSFANLKQQINLNKLISNDEFNTAVFRLFAVINFLEINGYLPTELISTFRSVESFLRGETEKPVDFAHELIKLRVQHFDQTIKNLANYLNPTKNPVSITVPLQYGATQKISFNPVTADFSLEKATNDPEWSRDFFLAMKTMLEQKVNELTQKQQNLQTNLN